MPDSPNGLPEETWPSPSFPKPEPPLNWRYILFKWNDSDEEMNLARQMAVDIGVDRLCWEVTDHPESAYSRRFGPAPSVNPSSTARCSFRRIASSPGKRAVG